MNRYIFYLAQKGSKNKLMSLAKRRADIMSVCKEDFFFVKFTVGCCVPDPVQRAEAGAL